MKFRILHSCLPLFELVRMNENNKLVSKHRAPPLSTHSRNNLVLRSQRNLQWVKSKWKSLRTNLHEASIQFHTTTLHAGQVGSSWKTQNKPDRLYHLRPFFDYWNCRLDPTWYCPMVISVTHTSRWDWFLPQTFHTAQNRRPGPREEPYFLSSMKHLTCKYQHSYLCILAIYKKPSLCCKVVVVCN